MWPETLAAQAAAFWGPEAWEAWEPDRRGLVAADPALTLLPWATSPRQCAVSNNSQTTDLIFCKKEKIIGHFYLNGMRSQTHRHTHIQWKLSLFP